VNASLAPSYCGNVTAGDILSRFGPIMRQLPDSDGRSVLEIRSGGTAGALQHFRGVIGEPRALAALQRDMA
jgi:hypothetical protein